VRKTTKEDSKEIGEKRDLERKVGGKKEGEVNRIIEPYRQYFAFPATCSRDLTAVYEGSNRIEKTGTMTALPKLITIKGNASHASILRNKHS
jgi:hypothetical protein